MTPETLYGLTPPLIALQFIAFGWSVVREINAADADSQTVIPLPDVINIMSLFATVGCLIILPIVTESYFWLSRIVLGTAFVLIAFHPFITAAHYRLWNRKSRRRQITDVASSPYVNREEFVVLLLLAVLATTVATYLGTH
jgi:hypothetical protein